MRQAPGFGLQWRRVIKRWKREHPTKTFQKIREGGGGGVQHWVDEDGSPPRRRAVAREAIVCYRPVQAVCGEVTDPADLQKVVSELVAGQNLLVDNLLK